MLLYDEFLTPLIPLLRLLHLHPSSSQLHRRLLYDDSRGVAEPLNETSDIFPDGLVVRGRLLLSLERPASAADIHRLLAQEMVLQPLLTFTDGDLYPNTKLEVRHIHSNINYFNFNIYCNNQSFLSSRVNVHKNARQLQKIGLQ